MDEDEVTLYLLHSDNQALEQYCAQRAGAFKILPGDLDSQAAAIRADNLDVLLFATNITSACNPVCLLAAHRLARAQIVGTGSVTTTGMRHIDNYMTGTATDSPQNAEHYSEQLLWLDGPAHCFSYGPDSEHTTTRITRADLGIADDAIVYVSGANMLKIVPELMMLWARLLGKQDNSVLMLYPYGPNWSNSYPKTLFRQRLLSVLATQGVKADRLLLLDPDPVPDRYQIREYLGIADIYLDSHPFSGTTSFIEPLQEGLPIVCRSGTNFRSSMGAALLKSIQLHELVADNDEKYIGIAHALYEDKVRRCELRDRILSAMAATPPFLDSERYAGMITRLFRDVGFDNPTQEKPE